jgi:alpha-methylacyl-CoA racemase
MDVPQSRIHAGPLLGLRVVEFEGIGPAPHCGMLFADLGADVLRIERAGGNVWQNPVVDRGRARLAVDLHTEEGQATAREILTTQTSSSRASDLG